MNCRERFDDLVSYSSGELAGPEKAELEKHLRVCPTCRRRLEKMQVVEDRVRASLCTPVPAPDLADAIMSRLPRNADPVERRRLWQWAAAFAILLAFWGLRTGVPVRQATPEYGGREMIQPQSPTLPHRLAAQKPTPEVARRVAPTLRHKPSRMPLGRHRAVSSNNPLVKNPAHSTPAVVITLTVQQATDPVYDSARVSQVMTVSVDGKVAASMERDIATVRPPLPANQHVASRPPLGPDASEPALPDPSGGIKEGVM